MSKDEKILLEKLERATSGTKDSDLEKVLLQMLERATNTDRDSDELSLQFFCNIVKNNNKMIPKAHELIIEKIRNGNSSISMKALALLAECMTKCGTDFQTETANFRFLNELIRLVSSKYEGNQTPSAIKEKIMELLANWTIEFPRKSKIKKVHEMLLREVNIDNPELKTNVNVNTKQTNVLGIDEEVLSKLLRSKDPEELKRANLYIGEQVKKDALRSDLCKHKDDLQEINNTILILNEMLDNYSPTDENANETIKDLYKKCKNSKKLLKTKTELLLHADTSLISDTLQTDDALQNAINKYKSVISGSSEASVPASSSSLSTEKISTPSINTDLLQDLNIKPIDSTTKVKKAEGLEENPLDELCDIFANVNYQEKSLLEMNALQPASLSLFPTQSECLKPAMAPLNPSTDKTNDTSLSNGKNSVVEKQKLSAFEEIQRLSEQLLKESLQKIQPPEEKPMDENMLPLMDINKERLPSELSIGSPSSNETLPSVGTNLVDQIINQQVQTSENTNNIPLSDIELAIDDVKPRSDVINVFQDPDLDINVVHAENRPSKDVTVILLVALNKSNLEMKDFRIEARARKRCKVRLLEPTATHIAAKKPFLPPNTIIQVLLLLNPTHETTDVTLLVEYTLGDDPDPINESVLIKDIPYVE